MNFGNNYPSQNTGYIYNNDPSNSMMTVFVNGESGAQAYPVASGNAVLLMDFDAGKFWIKSNVNGVPQRLRVFNFEEEITQEVNENVSREEFNNLSSNVANLADSVNKLLKELGGAAND